MKVDRCQHVRCGKPFPADVDRRKRFCADVCRQAANRLKRATERAGSNVVPLKPSVSAVSDPGRTSDLRGVWCALIASVAAQGVLVPGSAGVPVAHPALRFLAQIDAQLLKHEMHPAETSSTDDLDALITKALRATDAEGKAV